MLLCEIIIDSDLCTITFNNNNDKIISFKELIHILINAFVSNNIDAEL